MKNVFKSLLKYLSISRYNIARSATFVFCVGQARKDLQAAAVWRVTRLKLERASCDMTRDCVFASVILIASDKEKDGTRGNERGIEINAKLGETCVTI